MSHDLLVASPFSPYLPSQKDASSSSQQQVSKDIVDFFSAIEEEHSTTFNPKYDARLLLSEMANPQVSRGNLQSNPFAQLANGQHSQQSQIALQKTAIPRQTNPFDSFLPQQQSTPRPYLMSQTTGFQLQPPETSGFLQSPQQPFLQPRRQPARNNPFLQAMLVPQSTGMSLFGASQEQSTPNMPLPAPSMGASSNNTPAHPPSQPLQPAKSYQRGTKNPFDIITVTPPPVPKAPTALELTTRMAANGNTSQSQQSAEQPFTQQQTGAFNKSSFNNGTLNPGAADISSVASSFTFNPSVIGSTISDKSSSNNSEFTMGSQQTGTTATSSALSDSCSPQSNFTSPTMPGSTPVTSRATVFGGLKRFIPSSLFGLSLMESIPFPASTPTSPTTNSNAVNGPATSPGGANQLSSFSSNGSGNYSFLNNQPTGGTGKLEDVEVVASNRVVVEKEKEEDPRPDGEDIVSSADLENIPDNSQSHLPKRTEFGWQWALQQASIEDGRDSEDVEVVASTVVSPADIQTHQVVAEKEKEKEKEEEDPRPDGERIVSTTDVENVSDNAQPRLRKRTEFGWQWALQQASRADRREPEDLEDVASTVVSQADIQTPRRGKEKEEDLGPDDEDHDIVLNADVLNISDNDTRSHLRNGTEFGWQWALQQTPIAGRRELEDLDVVTSTVQTHRGKEKGSVSGWEDILRYQLQEEEEELEYTGPDGEDYDIDRNADEVNITDNTRSHLRNHTEFDWQWALQQTPITGRRELEDLEFVTSTVQTHRGKEKEEDFGLDGEDHDIVMNTDVLNIPDNPDSHLRYHTEFDWQWALQQTPITDRRELEDLEFVTSTVQTHRGKEKESVSAWEDVLRNQLQEEEEFVASSDGYLSEESAWILSLRSRLVEDEEDNVNNAVGSSSTSHFLHDFDFESLDSSMEGESSAIHRHSAENHECGVCNELFGEAQSIQLPMCGHPFCRECLGNYMKTKINEGRYPIFCPVCAIDRTRVNNSDITQEIVDKVELSKQDLEKLCDLQLVEHSVILRCPKCKKTMNVDREEYRSHQIIICPLPKCQRPWCKVCLKVLPNFEAEHKCKGDGFEQLMKKKGWKYCPGCKIPVQKEAGCNHITCGTPGCNIHFCYKCGVSIIDTSNGGDIGSAVTEHFNNCRL